MATQTATAREYCALLVKSKLLSAVAVDSLHRAWQAEFKAADEEVDKFRRYLVAKQLLTEWQSAMILRGHADGFFLGPYRILKRVGKGQMGGVYKAAHTSGQVVALKILPGSRAKDSHTLGRFQREARLLTQFDHPHVVRAFQVG